jgi:hypothetical protein
LARYPERFRDNGGKIGFSRIFLFLELTSEIEPLYPQRMEVTFRPVRFIRSEVQNNGEIKVFPPRGTLRGSCAVSARETRAPEWADIEAGQESDSGKYEVNRKGDK